MYKKIFLVGIMICSCFQLQAQIDSLKMNFDLRAKGELDNGARTLIPENKSPETTVQSRARLGIDYFYEKLQVYVSVQDVRTWGETNSTAG